MKKSFVIALHLGYWLCYLILIMVVLAMYFRTDENIDARLEEAFQIIFFFALIPSFITFYGCYHFLFPNYFQEKKYLHTILLGIGIAILAAVLGAGLLEMNVDKECAEDEGIVVAIQMCVFMSFIASISGVIAMVIRGFITWFEEIKLKENLIAKNHQMELAMVKSQLDPHFLFNTINNIDVLILKNAEKASDYLNNLSDIMRFMLYETKTDKILLSREVEYIEKYVELQKIRTANAKYVNLSITGKVANHTIAPMIFIPFIENAFKHASNKKLEDAITIRIAVESAAMRFECINKFNNTTKSKGQDNGLGMDLIQKRLHLIYPNQHDLQIIAEDNLYTVKLSIRN